MGVCRAIAATAVTLLCVSAAAGTPAVAFMSPAASCTDERSGAAADVADVSMTRLGLDSDLGTGKLQSADNESAPAEFYIYTKLNPVTPKVVVANVSSPSVDPFLDIAVIVHGFTSSATSETVTLIRDALLFKQNITVVAVQWARLASGPWFKYIDASLNTWIVAEHLSHFLLKLEEDGVDLNRVHLIGHSLGAHIVGFTAKLLKGRIGRITGLDPAFPGFDANNSTTRLDATDGKFVVVLHTCGGILGFLEPLGHADFYPNGGKNQPHCARCTNPSCDHSMVILYFVESIYNAVAFPSRSCSSWVDFDKGLCDTNDVALMGYHTPMTSRGKYYLRTNAQEPFSIPITDAEHKGIDSSNDLSGLGDIGVQTTNDRDSMIPLYSSTCKLGDNFISVVFALFLCLYWLF